MGHSFKALIATLLLIAGAFFCLFTNPKQSAYIDWANHYYLSQTAPHEKGLTQLFLQALSTSHIANHTTSTNYLLFTLYETKDEHICLQAIGILDHFIPLKPITSL